MSTITLFDGLKIAEIDVLPASASRLLYRAWEAEAGKWRPRGARSVAGQMWFVDLRHLASRACLFGAAVSG